MDREENQHPVDFLLHSDLIPSVWCSGCGIGIVVNTFLQTVKKMDMDPDRICVVSSGLSCTGKIPEYLRFKQVNIVNGDVLLHAAAIKKDNPDSKTVVFLNDSDFMVSGIEGFLKVCKRQTDLSVIYINNYIYQIFIEPKGKHLQKTDEWKEKLLLEIKEMFDSKDIIKFIETKKYRVIGVPFFNQMDENTFKEELLKAVHS